MRIKETVRRGRCEPQLKERAAADAVAWATSHGRKKTADVYEDCSEITPNMDLVHCTSSVDPSSQDFLIQSDVFFARGDLDATCKKSSRFWSWRPAIMYLIGFDSLVQNAVCKALGIA